MRNRRPLHHADVPNQLRASRLAAPVGGADRGANHVSSVGKGRLRRPVADSSRPRRMTSRDCQPPRPMAVDGVTTHDTATRSGSVKVVGIGASLAAGSSSFGEVEESCRYWGAPTIWARRSSQR